MEKRVQEGEEAAASVSKKARAEGCSEIPLKEWLGSLGGDTSSLERVLVKAIAGSDDRSLFASTTIPAGEVIATIPARAVLSPPRVLESEVGKALSAAYPFHFVVCVFLAHAKCVAKEKHPFAPFIASLPALPPNAPWWGTEVRVLLQGSNLGFACDSTRSLLQQRWTEAVASHPELLAGIDFEALEWAAGMYDSRRFPLRLTKKLGEATDDARNADGDADAGPADGVGCMIPFLDMGNHGMDSTVEWGTDASGGVTFREMGHDLSSNDPVVFNYGSKGNEELLMAYGFAIENNQYDTYSLVLSVGTAPPPAPQKSLGPFVIRLPRSDDADGALAQFPRDLWEALADPMAFEPATKSAAAASEGEEEPAEIDIDDVEFLLFTLRQRLEKVEAHQERHAEAVAAAAASVVEKDDSRSETEPQQLEFLGWYFQGHRRVLAAAVSELEKTLLAISLDENQASLSR